MSTDGAPDLRLAPDVLDTLGRLGVARDLEPGEPLFRRGDDGDSMFVVEGGEVVLRFGAEKHEKRLAAGELFGELALVLGSHRRTADAAAGVGCTVRELGPSSIERLEAESPQVLLRVLRRCCAYLVISERRLIDDLRARNTELERTLGSLRRTRRERDQHHALALTDELTGLANRRGLRALLDRAREDEPGRSLALVVVDVDRFKAINDRWGHAFGDQVLRLVAEALRGAVRADDIAARLGGDEFAVVLPGLGEREAVLRARALLEALGGLRPETAGRPVVVTVSMGGARAAADEPWERLLERADLALYRAKEAGRRRLAWSDRVVAVADPSGES